MTNNGITITCPSCFFSQTVPHEKLPPKAVNTTCPQCKTSFLFASHVKSPIRESEVSPSAALHSADAGHPVTKSPPVPPIAGKRLAGNPIVTQSIIILTGIALYALGTPWYAAVLVVLAAPYWFGPILVYFTQRMPTNQPLKAVSAESNLHPEIRLFLDKTVPALEAAGFVLKGSLTTATLDATVSAIVTIMQHATASDVAQLLAVVKDGRVGRTIGFSRSRADGSRLRTSWSTIPSPFPPAPQDNSLRVGSQVAPEDLWRVHHARTAADTSVIREEPISDALSYQMNEERQGVQTKLASGQWRHAGPEGLIRPTLMGAYSMCLRMLFPWKQLSRRSAESEARRYLKESNGEPVAREVTPVEMTRGTTDAEQDPELAGLVNELRSLGSEEKKFGSLTLLIITVMVFFSAQVISTTWQEILILVGVLFFHELGHMAAMKLLKYSDLKMFFIPFFGAAVSGKDSAPTALKSCIVSLMGPLPGIVLSVPLFLLFFLTKNYYLFKTAQVMMFLNVFNLLPIMPLDGGRFVDVLFINRRYFRFVFSFLGAAIFICLAAAAHDLLLGLFGGVTIYVALTNLKLHGISNELKSEGMTVGSVTDLLSDSGSLKRVVAKIRSHFPRLFDPNMDYKGIYGKLTTLVDTIKFKPAKFLPKTLLLGTYATCALASIFGLFLLVGANYRECSRTVEAEGKTQTYAEQHAFGKKRSECLINSQLLYDGKGTAYDSDGSVSGVYYYKDGYRTAEWPTFDSSGKVVEKRIYDRGRLITVSTLENGGWKTITTADMPLLMRWSEEIQRLSQPFKSNYRYFSTL